MIVKRGGQYKTIDPNEYGIWLEAGYVKVSDGNVGDSTPIEEREKRDELPKLTLEEVQETDKFVKLADSKESLATRHGESDVEPELDENGCYGGVCETVEKAEETERQQNNKNNNKNNRNRK